MMNTVAVDVWASPPPAEGSDRTTLNDLNAASETLSSTTFTENVALACPGANVRMVWKGA